MIFTVYADKAEEVSKRLDKLAKKAARYNVPFYYTISDEHPETVNVFDDFTHKAGSYKVAAVDFDIACEELIKANGWTVLAISEAVNETAEPEVNHDEPMKMSDVVTKLESLFDILNRVYFDNALPKPVITVQSTPKAYGHCSTKKIWKGENDGQYEINIGAEFLNRPSANTAATMCHEMVHLYCLVNEIQDTCQKGRYHNKTFKAEAEARDLEIGYDRTVGFSHTNPTEAFKKTLEDNGFVLEVPFARVMPEEKAKAEREKPHRYVCPVCGQEVKTTADLSLICGICEVAMERAD